MKKRLTRWMAAAFIGIALLVVVQSYEATIRKGRPLPPGKVRPQLVNDGDTALLLAPDGSLWAWGGGRSDLMSVFAQAAAFDVPHRVGADSDWSAIASAGRHTLALKSDGSLWAWGWNARGEVGQGNFSPKHYGTPARIGTETNWTRICTGMEHSIAIKSDGSLWAWGANTEGVLGIGTTNDSFVPTMIGVDRDWRMIAADSYTSFAIKNNGTLWGWGQGISKSDLVPKQIAFDTDWSSISAKNYSPLLALKTDGTL